MFPGEDQWAAVVNDEGGKDWVQIGDLHHKVGQSHRKWHYPEWGSKKGNFVWRHVLLWKDAANAGETAGLIKSTVIAGEDEQGEGNVQVNFDKIVPKKLYLSTIRVFKYTNNAKPKCVKEILCENNLKPAMDYGPSVAYYGNCIYYFKREIENSEIQKHQLYKFEFDGYKETKIERVQFLEDSHSKM